MPSQWCTVCKKFHQIDCTERLKANNAQLLKACEMACTAHEAYMDMLAERNSRISAQDYELLETLEAAIAAAKVYGG